MTKALLEIIKRLYGSKALSKTIGTRTNVITLPDKETKKFVTQELNIEAASDAAAQKAKDDIEKLIPEIPKMNDQEILTLTGNLRRLENKINPPSAEVFEFGTKQPVSKEGIASLTEQAGQKTPPGTLMGDLESRINQLRASGKELEDITKGKGMTLEDLLQDPTRSGGPLDPKVGIVRTAAREILEKNLKAGKIDIPDEAAKDAILKSYQGGVDPIDVLRKTYGEGVLEQLDDIADELNKASDYKDIQKILQREKLFEAKPKKTYGYDEGVYSDEEMAKILTDETPDEFATGGRVGFAEGGSKGLNYLMGLPAPRTNFAVGSPAETVDSLYDFYSKNISRNNLYPNNPFYSGNISGNNLYPNNPFYSSAPNDYYQSYLSYLNELQSKDPINSSILYSQPSVDTQTSVDGGGDGDGSQTGPAPTSSGSGISSIGNAISSAVGSMTPGRAIGTAIGYGIAGPIGGFIGGKIGSSVGGGDSGTTGTGTPSPGDTGGAGGDPSDPGSEPGTPGPGDTGGAGGNPGDPGSEASSSSSSSSSSATSPGDTGGAGGADGAGGSDAGGGTYVCTASYANNLITPLDFRTLKQYGIKLRKNDKYLMKAYDWFGPKLASAVKKGKLINFAKHSTSMWKYDQTKQKDVSFKIKLMITFHKLITRPIVRTLGVFLTIKEKITK